MACLFSTVPSDQVVAAVQDLLHMSFSVVVTVWSFNEDHGRLGSVCGLQGSGRLCVRSGCGVKGKGRLIRVELQFSARMKDKNQAS